MSEEHTNPVPSGWAERSLGDFVSLQRGYDLPAHRRGRGNVPILGSFGITGHHDTARVKGPGVTIGRSGASFGVVCFSDVDFWPLNTTLFVTDFKGNDEIFSYYLLKLIDFRRFNSGSAQPSLNRNYLTSIHVSVPPLSEQKAIGCLLRGLDDKIELNRRMNETLEAMARAIFKSWFVDFDPVRAKAEGRQPFGMDAETAARFPDSFEDSPLGEIPAGWRVGSMSELLSLSREAVNPGDSPGELFDHYSIPAYDEGRWPNTESGEQIKSNKFLVPSDAVLLSKLNPRLPRIWLPTVGNARRSIASTEFLVAQPQAGFSRDYIFALLRSQNFLRVFQTLVTGTSGSHQRVRPESLLAMDVVVPSRQCVKLFTCAIAPLLARAAGNLAESRPLATLRDALLPRLVSGQIRLRHTGQTCRRGGKG